MLDLVLLQRQPHSHAYPVSSLFVSFELQSYLGNYQSYLGNHQSYLGNHQSYLGNHAVHFFIIAMNVHLKYVKSARAWECPVFDRLQHATTDCKRSKTGRWEGLGSNETMYS